VPGEINAWSLIMEAAFIDMPPAETADKTLLDVLSRHARTRPNTTALRFLANGDAETDMLTFGELVQRTQSLATRLYAGEEPGTSVLLLLDSGLAFVQSLFACMYAGLIPVTVDLPRPNRSTDRLEAIVRHSGCRACITSNAELARVEKLMAAVPSLAKLNRYLVEGDLQQPASQPALPRPAAEATAFIQYTSGSTSAPKGVVITHGNLLANQVQIKAGFRHDERTKFLGWLPMFHDMGLIGIVMHPLFLGVECTLMPPAAFIQRPLRWLTAMSKYRATTTGAPNFAFDHCVSRIADSDLQGLDLSSWRVAFCGAEKVRAATLREFARKFAPAGFDATSFLPCYGLAEATLFASGLSHFGEAQPRVVRVTQRGLEQGRMQLVDASAEVAGSMELVSNGPPAVGQQVEVVDPETGQRCSEGQIGEIWLGGPNVALAYAHDSEKTASLLNAKLDSQPGRFLVTGDLGAMWEGELFVVGRLKNLVIVRGRKVYAEDIEQLVGRSCELFLPNRCAAFAVDTKGEGGAGQESLVIVQEASRRPRSEAEVEEARAHARELLATQLDLVLHDIILVKPNSIPMTSSGKIRHGKLRSAYLAGETKPFSPGQAVKA
jgi:acyl-CoA synthetase (AMP-forming)/AMP-acid ligase II